jgi:drug/metabolite transporter (DMT)-like permease
VSAQAVGPALAKPHSALAGIALVLAAVSSFGAMDTTIKFISTGVPVLMALWFRFGFQTLVTAAVFAPTRGRSLLHTAHPRFQALRGLLLVGSSALAFLSLRYTPVAEFTAIFSITPLVITLIAAYRLKERVSPLRWALVAGGFIGTLIIIRPQQDAFNWALLLPLVLVGTGTWFQILTSKMARTESPVTMHFYTGLVGFTVASIALPWVWVPLASHLLWWCILLICLLGSAGHFLLILAYQRASAAVLTPYLYGQIAAAMLGGWMVFSQVPDGWSFVGIAMIAICGAVGAWLTMRESRAVAASVTAMDM